MSKEEIKKAIDQAIRSFSSGNSTQNSLALFQILGYDTQRQAPLDPPSFEGFRDAFITGTSFNESKAKAAEWKYSDLLFQLSKEEIEKQASLFDAREVVTLGDTDMIIQTYLFFVIELTGDRYSRTDLAHITREVNRLFPMPAMVLFKYGSFLTLSVINRRLHKRDQNKDVLDKVTLIKDICYNQPHRAHIEILLDLSFDELKRKHEFTNFVELHLAWQKTLDTKELNKRFYKKLYNWYAWAKQYAWFPQIRPEKEMLDERTHQSESLIRLLTRLLFVWFMKEKGLINPDLFNLHKLKNILKDFKGPGSDLCIYYKAILQNLFFATINKPVPDRKVINSGYNPKEYGDPLVYRYKELFAESRKILDYFENIPFLNGGLFDCLDQKKDDKNLTEIRLDGFSTKKYKQPKLPDKLFFGEYSGVDLSSEYSDNRKNNETVIGLIDLLQTYKFTIEENTPVEEEIALDPELLGKVFEELLASYNPETQTTARKQTGSFYTPREIVEYMVDTSLLAYLKNHVDDEVKLRQLLSYDATVDELANPFDEHQTLALLHAIDECRVLDPACGSGAFPMGMLHKMIHILHKLDPENKTWFGLMINNFPPYMRAEVSKRLAKENWNYIRKLGILQQCIHGTDIQPIAIQIAKLRFFISLLVDQKEKPGEPNRGFEPLPNLDFKLVAANALVAPPEPDFDTSGLFSKKDDPFFQAFDALTEKHFSASRPKDKAVLKADITKLLEEKCRQKIREIESKISHEDKRFSEVLSERHKQFVEKKKHEIALWESYKNLFRNEAVGFFDPSYFFPKVDDGFDILIGNPPYIQLQHDHGKLAKLYQDQGFETFTRTGDIYQLFYEKGMILLRHNGNLCYITSNKWMRAGYGGKLRAFFLKYNPKILLDLGPGIFESSTVDTNILLIEKATNENRVRALTLQKNNDGIHIEQQVRQRASCLDKLSKDAWFIGSSAEQSLKEKIESMGKPLKDWDVNIYRGVLTGLNEAFIINQAKKEETLANCRNDEERNRTLRILKPILRGRDIKRYHYEWAGLWLLFIPWHFPLNRDMSIEGASLKAEKEFELLYPSLYNYLCRFKDDLTKRNKDETGIRYEWYALQRCAATYYPEFEKEKAVWKEMSLNPTFSYDKNGMFCVDTGRILTGERIKFFLGLFNSRLFKLSFAKYYAGGGLGDKGIRFKSEFMKEYPVPEITSQNITFVNIIEKVADEILCSRSQDTCPDTTAWEREIDEAVYRLYDLTDDEIGIIEGR